MSRFDYVKYDEVAMKQQEIAKAKVTDLEMFISSLGGSRNTSLALTKLEEVYMWIGKELRDDCVKRGTAELQEARSNS